MKGIEKRIQVSLMVFLGLCSLIVNGTAFYILVNYHSEHYRELAEVHMAQQYQNLSQRLAVLEEQIRFFGADELLAQEIKEKNWIEADDRITAFVQNSNGIISLEIYTGTEEGWECRSYGAKNMAQPDQEILEKYWDRVKKTPEDEVWMLREGNEEGQECLSYLMPVQAGEEKSGFFLANVAVSSFINSLEGAESDLWEEHLSIISEAAAWYSDDHTEESLSKELLLRGEIPQLIGDEIIYVKELPATGSKLVQRIFLKTRNLLLPAGICLLLIFLGSLAAIYFGSRVISRTIAVPLNEMREKMKNTLNQ